MQALEPECLKCSLTQPPICPTNAEDLHPIFLQTWPTVAPPGQLYFGLPQFTNNLLRRVLLLAHQLAPFLCPDTASTDIRPGPVFGGEAT